MKGIEWRAKVRLGRDTSGDQSADPDIPEPRIGGVCKVAGGKGCYQQLSLNAGRLVTEGKLMVSVREWNCGEAPQLSSVRGGSDAACRPPGIRLQSRSLAVEETLLRGVFSSRGGGRRAPLESQIVFHGWKMDNSISSPIQEKSHLERRSSFYRSCNQSSPPNKSHL